MKLSSCLKVFLSVVMVLASLNSNADISGNANAEASAKDIAKTCIVNSAKIKKISDLNRDLQKAIFQAEVKYATVALTGLALLFTSISAAEKSINVKFLIGRTAYVSSLVSAALAAMLIYSDWGSVSNINEIVEELKTVDADLEHACKISSKIKS